MIELVHRTHGRVNMKLRTLVGCVCLLAIPAALSAADPEPDDLLGRWELTEEAAKIPKGAIFDFQKEGKLVVTVNVKGQKKSLDLGYELKKNVLTFTLPDKKTSSTEVVTLTKTELVCKDATGTTAKFKRLSDDKKDEKEDKKDK